MLHESFLRKAQQRICILCGSLFFCLVSISLIELSVVPATSGARAAGFSELIGLWRTHNGKLVRFYTCGRQVCGRIVKTRGSQLRDTNNPKPHLRKRAIKGLTIIRSRKKTGPKLWTGTVYNFADGRTYSGSLKLLNKTSAKLTGCMNGSICQTAHWRKISN